MSFFQKIRDKFGLGEESPLDESSRLKIQAIVERNAQNWRSEYTTTYQKALKERIAQKKEIHHSLIDREVRVRVRVDDLKQHVIEEAKTELPGVIWDDLPENEKTRGFNENESERALNRLVSKLVDQMVNQISRKSEKRFRGARKKAQQRKEHDAKGDFRRAKMRAKDRGLRGGGGGRF